MKNNWLILFLIGIYGCQVHQFTETKSIHPKGNFMSDSSYMTFEINPDSTFTWYNEPKSGMLSGSSLCAYRSKGKWKQIWPNVLELTSDNVTKEFHWFRYELEEKSAGSPDSVYLEVIPAEQDLAVQYFWLLDGHEVISTGKSQVTKTGLMKKYLKWYRLTLYVMRDNTRASWSSGADDYYVFQETIDLGATNSITVYLPDLTSCRLYFEPIDHEYLLLESETEIRWRGSVWRRISPQDTVSTK